MVPGQRTFCLWFAALAFAGCGQSPTPAAPGPTALQALQTRCEEDMLRQVCRVSTGDPAAQAPDPASVIFLAGVGVIDATAYAELQAAGPAMCKTVVDACRQDWGGKRCMASRALFGAAGS